MKYLKSAICILIVCLMLTGCNFRMASSIDDLISPVSPFGDNADIQKAMPVMERHSNESAARLENTQKEYAELKEQAQNFDVDELCELRRNIRPQVEYDTEAELYDIYGVSFSRGIFSTAKSETDNSIDGNEIYSVRRQLEDYKQQQNEPKHEKHQFSHDDEDEIEM